MNEIFADSVDAKSFMMGEFRVALPSRLRYTTNHMWAEPVAGQDLHQPNVFRFGLTAYAVRLLQDVYFLDWILEPPTQIIRRQQLGSIESKKAESDLFSPTTGSLVGLNPNTINDPSLVNVDLYGAGWMLEIVPADERDLLDVDAYLKHLDQAWPLAQRTIKGQI